MEIILKEILVGKTPTRIFFIFIRIKKKVPNRVVVTGLRVLVVVNGFVGTVFIQKGFPLTL